MPLQQVDHGRRHATFGQAQRAQGEGDAMSDGDGAPDGASDALAAGSGLAEVIGAESSPSLGGPSADSVKIARAFQIIQPLASLSSAACISVRTWSAVYGAKEP